ncbi:hypothetical protein BJ508DRAFT_75429 [Ascobolus immersus RN42]|uniref:Uncharacterized protein n=1 Tax=Ascobolus immersus RN42 TaxID=1160509 RepID=A0A3N4HRR3_ASCIM|nr:hypothetical protein BJ508DRAFT_75429 [Ascobolus immersus RN42]
MQKTFRLKKEKLLEKLRRRGSNSADEASPSPSVSRQCSREVSREVAVDAPSTRSRHESPRSYAARNRSSNWTEEPVRSRPVSRQESLRREAREEREEREAAASSRDLGTPSPSSTRNTGFFTPMGVLPSTITNDAAVYTPEEDPIENDVPNHTDPKNEPKHEPKKEKEQEQNTEMDKMDLDKKPMSPIRIAPEELEIFVQEATPTPTQGGKFPVRKSSLQGRKVNGTEMPKVPKVETNGVTNGLTVSVPTTPLGNGLPSLSPTNSVLSTPTSPNPFSQVGLRQEPFRRQSLLPQNSQTLIRNLLTPSAPPSPTCTASTPSPKPPLRRPLRLLPPPPPPPPPHQDLGNPPLLLRHPHPNPTNPPHRRPPRRHPPQVPQRPRPTLRRARHHAQSHTATTATAKVPRARDGPGAGREMVESRGGLRGGGGAVFPRGPDGEGGVGGGGAAASGLRWGNGGEYTSWGWGWTDAAGAWDWWAWFARSRAATETVSDKVHQ